MMISTEIIHPEKSLWAAVILQALNDIDSGLGGGTTYERNQRRQSRRWFIEGGKDFIDVCTLADISPDKVRKEALRRIDKVEAKARAITGKGNTRIYIEYEGEQLSLVELAKRTGIKIATIHHRYRQGIRGLDLVAPLEAGGTKHTYTHNGQTLTSKEWSKITGLKAGTIVARIRMGWTVEKALTVTTEETKQARIEHRTEMFKAIAKARKGKPKARKPSNKATGGG